MKPRSAHSINLVAILLAALMLCGASALAQHRRPVDRIRAAKIAYITDRLHMSRDQSAHFVPVYNDYEREIFDTRQQFKRKYEHQGPTYSDDVYRQYIDDNLEYQQIVLDIKKKYKDEFLRVISPQQLSDLYTAEREFKQMLMKRLDVPRRGGGRFRDRRTHD